MARPTLDRNPKFKLLCRVLGLPRPYVRGLLELMWDTAHDSGNPVLGAPAQVEAAAEWPGDPGVLFRALRDCRFIDQLTDVNGQLTDMRYTSPKTAPEPPPNGQKRAPQTPENGRQLTDLLTDGVWQIHDYWHHAPAYVAFRADRETERTRDKVCGYCGSTYHSPDWRSRYCKAACRVMACRKRTGGELTDVNGRLTDVNATPLTPHPSPIDPSKDNNPPSPLAGGEGEKPAGAARVRQPKAPLPSVPASLDTPEFRAAWADWLAYRAEARKPVLATSAESQFKRLAAMGPTSAAAAIRHSIAQGYQGITLPADDGGARRRVPPPVGRKGETRAEVLRKHREKQAAGGGA